MEGEEPMSTTTTRSPRTGQTIVGVQTVIRTGLRILKVLKGTAEYRDMTLGDLLEGILLHVFEGKTPFQKETLKKIAELEKVYDLDASNSHRLHEAPGGGRCPGTAPARCARRRTPASSS